MFSKLLKNIGFGFLSVCSFLPRTYRKPCTLLSLTKFAKTQRNKIKQTLCTTQFYNEKTFFDHDK